MKKNGRWYYPFLWLLLFSWVNMFPFRGWLFPVSGLEFVLCFVLMATFHYEEAPAAALAIGAGAFLDAAMGNFIHIVIFTGVFFVAKLLKSTFYRPGSVFHVLAYAPVLLAANLLLYAGTTRGAFSVFRFPALFLLEWSGVNFALFLAMLMLFNPRPRAVMYKMR
jgi:hypothetical protein